MTIPTDDAPVVDDTATSQFVVRESGTAAELVYALEGDRIDLKIFDGRIFRGLRKAGAAKADRIDGNLPVTEPAGH